MSSDASTFPLRDAPAESPPVKRRWLRGRTRSLTQAGVELRSAVEDRTDELAYAPWRTLADDEADELSRIATAFRAAVQSAKVFPGGAFGPRHGQHR